MKKIIFNREKIKTFLFIFICFFPYLQPASYCIGDIFSSIINLWIKLTWILALFLTIKSNKISKCSVLFILFQSFFVISTFLNENYGNLQESIYLFCNNCSLVLLTEYFLKKNTDCFLKYTSSIFGILILINIVTMFMFYPNGMYTDILGDNNYYFLEHDNGSFFYALPVIFLSIIYSLKKYNKVTFGCYLFLIVNILGYVHIRSAIAFTCLIILFLSLIFMNNKIFNRIINSNVINIILIIILFGLLFFNIQNFFTTNILNFFQKDITLSGRTVIWQKSFEFIKENPIIGYGQEFLQIRLLRFGISHVHNILLQILYNGGLISLFIYIIYILMVKKSVNNCENYKIRNIMKITLYLYFFASIFDFYNTKFIVYIIFVCCSNVNLFNKKEGEKNE